VLCPCDESFRVWHEAKHSSGFVTQAGEIAPASVGVIRITVHIRRALRRRDVGDRILTGIGDGLQTVSAGEEHASFTMGNRQLVHAARVEEDTAIGPGTQSHPPVLEARWLVLGNGTAARSVAVIPEWQDAGLHEHLEAVADAEHDLAAPDECVERIAQVAAHLRRKDPSGSNVVAVTEPTWDGERLELVEHRRMLDQPADVHARGTRTGQFPGVLGLEVAIGASRSEYQYAYLCHEFADLPFQAR